MCIHATVNTSFKNLSYGRGGGRIMQLDEQATMWQKGLHVGGRCATRGGGEVGVSWFSGVVRSLVKGMLGAHENF